MRRQPGLGAARQRGGLRGAPRGAPVPFEAGLLQTASATSQGPVGSAVSGWPESPRAQPAHWLLAVLKCFHPSPKACGQTSAAFTCCSLQASKTTVLQHIHFYCGGASGCGSCCLFGHKMKKKKGKAVSRVFLFSCYLCPMLGLGRMKRNVKKGMSV